MIFASVDIETSGLNPDMHQILEIAIVIDGHPFREVEIEKLPMISLLIRRPTIIGEAAALAMNKEILDLIAEQSCESVDVDTAGIWIETFLRWHGRQNRIVPAGKNFGSFDRQFIRRQWPEVDKTFAHRSLDPAMFFLRPGDERPPSLQQCVERCPPLAGTAVAHRAVDDARLVCKLFRSLAGTPAYDAIYGTPGKTEGSQS